MVSGDRGPCQEAAGSRQHQDPWGTSADNREKQSLTMQNGLLACRDGHWACTCDTVNKRSSSREGRVRERGACMRGARAGAAGAP